MNKVRGKALALVLSIALVVSSFSTVFSFAASHTEKATGINSGALDDFYLVNGSGYTDDKESVSIGTEVKLNTAEHEEINANLAALSRADGPDLVKWDLEKDDDGVVTSATLKLRGNTQDGTETLKALYKGSTTDDDDNVTNYTYVDEFTVTVYDEDSVIIADTSKVGVDPTGTDIAFDKTFAKKSTDSSKPDSVTVGVYQATHGEDDAKVVWNDVTSDYTLTGKGDITEDITAAGGKVTVAEDAGIGNVTITAEKVENPTNDTLPDDKVTAKSKITKTLLVNDSAASYEFTRDGSTTYLNDTQSVNGYEVKFNTAEAKAVTVDSRASVDTISGTVASVDVEGGSVNTIDLDKGDVTVSGEKSKTDDITTDDGDVTVDTGATTGSIDANVVDVTDAKTGDITADGNVTVEADEEDAVTTTGDITSGGEFVTLSTGDDSAKLTVGTLKSDAAQEFDISGNTTIGGVDFNYYDSTLSFSDFEGKVPAPKNVSDGEGAIETTTADDSVEVTGDATFGTVTAEDETTIKFDSEVTADDVEGPGSVVIKAGNLTVQDGIYDVILKLSDEPITSGLKVFRASAGAVDVDDFTPYGYTLKLAEGNDYDTFTVDKLAFVGVEINGNGRILKDTKATFTASAYPTGSAFPEGYSVEWSVDNSDKFTATTNADGSVTVAAANYDVDFTSENKGTLTATLVDEDGYEYEEDYEPGSLELTEIAVPDTTYKSDTTGTYNLALGGNYTFKITSLNGQPVTFAVANGGATVTLVGASGNDYFYKVTGAKVGDYGVYVNKDASPVAVLHITNNIKIDTTVVTIAVGNTYQFKVTAPAQPRFQVAGIGDIALTSKSGNDYFYKVTAPNAKGAHGVYVNGVRLAVITIA